MPKVRSRRVEVQGLPQLQTALKGLPRSIRAGAYRSSFRKSIRTAETILRSNAPISNNVSYRKDFRRKKGLGKGNKKFAKGTYNRKTKINKLRNNISVHNDRRTFDGVVVGINKRKSHLARWTNDGTTERRHKSGKSVGRIKGSGWVDKSYARAVPLLVNDTRQHSPKYVVSYLRRRTRSLNKKLSIGNKLTIR